MFLSVLFSRLPGAISTAMRDAVATPAFQRALQDPAILADPLNAQFAKAISGGGLGGFSLDDTSTVNHLAPVFAHPIKVGFATSMDLVFLIGAAVCALGVVILLFMPNITLSNRSPQAQRQDSLADAAAVAPQADESPEGYEPVAPRHRAAEDLLDAAAAESAGHTLLEAPDDPPTAPRRAQPDA